MKKQIRLRQHGHGLGMSVPRKFRLALGLQPGDVVDWDEDGNTAILKFYRVREERTPALEKQEKEATVEAG